MSASDSDTQLLKPSRRQMFAVGAATIACTAVGSRAEAVASASPVTDDFERIKFCLNTSTVRGQKLTLPEIVDVASAAGYDAIEPWIPQLKEYAKTGSIPDLKKRIADAGLTVESAIGFAKWIVEDDAQRATGLQEARRDMDLLKSIGGVRIAAPPVGAQNESGLELMDIANRYHALLEVGRETGVTPQLELWGFSKTLSRLGELAFVASECGHADAIVLPDVYHIYKGGSAFEGLGMIEASKIEVFHMNDYPAEPPRETIGDADRVYPGDGVAPLNQIIGGLVENGFDGFFSLELFNREYWKQDAKLVATTGLQKMKAAVAAASAAAK